jgi:hypothetical protein
VHELNFDERLNLLKRSAKPQRSGPPAQSATRFKQDDLNPGETLKQALIELKRNGRNCKNSASNSSLKRINTHEQEKEFPT